MPKYFFQATDNNRRKVTGELAAEDVTSAIRELEGRGLTVQSIRLSSLPEEHSTSQAGSRHDDQTEPEHAKLEHQFDAAIKRREILIPALTALAEDVPSRQARRELRQLVDTLRQSRSGSELRRSKVATQWLPFLVTDFTSQSTPDRLSDLVAHTSQESENRSNRRRLFAYPLLLLIVAFAVFALLCAIVVPTFGSMFYEFGVSLPTATYVIIVFAEEMSGHPIRFVTVTAFIAALIYVLVRLWFHFAITTRLFGFLTAGNSASVSAMSSLTSQLAELLSIDVPLADALWYAGQGCGHYHFTRVAEQLARHAHRGTEKLSNSPVAHNLPANVILALESPTGGKPNVTLLRELSALYSDRAAARIDWSTGALAQFAIVVIGIAVGFVIIALFLPLVMVISGLTEFSGITQ